MNKKHGPQTLGGAFPTGPQILNFQPLFFPIPCITLRYLPPSCYSLPCLPLPNSVPPHSSTPLSPSHIAASLFSSRTCGLFSVTTLPQPFPFQPLADSFYRDGGCTLRKLSLCRFPAISSLQNTVSCSSFSFFSTTCRHFFVFQRGVGSPAYSSAVNRRRSTSASLMVLQCAAVRSAGQT